MLPLSIAQTSRPCQDAALHMPSATQDLTCMLQQMIRTAPGQVQMQSLVIIQCFAPHHTGAQLQIQERMMTHRICGMLPLAAMLARKGRVGSSP